MKHDNDELIKEAMGMFKDQMVPELKPTTVIDVGDVLFKVIKALKAENGFCVFEHLDGGGKAIDEYGAVIEKDEGGNVRRIDGNNENIQVCALYLHKWKPHKEAPLAAGLYWSVCQGREAIRRYNSSYWFPYLKPDPIIVADVEVCRNPDGSPMQIIEPATPNTEGV